MKSNDYVHNTHRSPRDRELGRAHLGRSTRPSPRRINLDEGNSARDRLRNDGQRRVQRQGEQQRNHDLRIQSQRPARRANGQPVSHGKRDAPTAKGDQEVRRTRLVRRERPRSVGADVLAFPRIDTVGSDESRRTRDRGETVRRVDEQRTGAIAARPAVYTGEKAKTRQRIALGNWFVALVVVAAIIMSCTAVYGPVKNYYTAWRDNGILQVENDVLERQHQELEEAVKRLQTEEGVEEEARRRGFVKPDESGLVVDEELERQLADPAEVEAAIVEYEESLPWYIHMLDSLFGYERS